MRPSREAEYTMRHVYWAILPYELGFNCLFESFSSLFRAYSHANFNDRILHL